MRFVVRLQVLQHHVAHVGRRLPTLVYFLSAVLLCVSQDLGHVIRVTLYRCVVRVRTVNVRPGNAAVLVVRVYLLNELFLERTWTAAIILILVHAKA